MTAGTVVKDNISYYILFANGNPIRLEAGTTSDRTKVFVGNGTDPVALPPAGDITPDGDANTGYDLSNAYIVGGSDGRTESVSVKSTRITMNGGKVYRILAGNYGSEKKVDWVSQVTGDATVDINGGTVVDYINAGRCNTSIDGTFYLTITDGTFEDNCYVHAGVWAMEQKDRRTTTAKKKSRQKPV